MTGPDDASAIETCIARMAITDQIYRYARSMDRRDVELGYAVFHEDATTDYGDGFYTGSGRGFIDWVTELHGGFLTHSHQMTNVIIEVAGERAASETYAIVALLRQEGEETIRTTSFCRYVDRWSRRAGRWAIDHRMIVLDIGENRVVDPPARASRGSRDRADPSYANFAAL